MVNKLVHERDEKGNVITNEHGGDVMSPLREMEFSFSGEFSAKRPLNGSKKSHDTKIRQTRITVTPSSWKVAQTDDDGNVVTENVPVLDEKGNAVTDDDGNVVTHDVPVLNDVHGVSGIELLKSENAAHQSFIVFNGEKVYLKSTGTFTLEYTAADESIRHIHVQVKLNDDDVVIIVEDREGMAPKTSGRGRKTGGVKHTI